MAKKRRAVPAVGTGEPITTEWTDTDPDAFTVMPDGRKMQRTVFGLSEEQVERIRQGFICIKCLEVYAIAFPDACKVCGFPMRDHQAEEFAKDFRGGVAFGPSTTLEEEYAIAEEMIQREAYEKATRLGLILPKPSIIVPRGT